MGKLVLNWPMLIFFHLIFRIEFITLLEEIKAWRSRISPGPLLVSFHQGGSLIQSTARMRLLYRYFGHRNISILTPRIKSQQQRDFIERDFTQLTGVGFRSISGRNPECCFIMSHSQWHRKLMEVCCRIS